MVRAAAIASIALLAGCSSAGDVAGYALLGDAWTQHKQAEFLGRCVQTLPQAECLREIAEWNRQLAGAGAAYSPQTMIGASAQSGQTVYNASQCIGAIVNGACHGSIMQDGANHPVCHGEMLNGQCTGPLF